MIPGGVNELLLRSAAAGGATAGRSVRFNSADSAFLSRTPASSGNLTQWSWSAWVKLGNLSNGGIFSAGTSDTDYFRIYYFGASGAATLQFVHQISGSVAAQVRTAAVLRDPSAWYHIVYVWDSANSTAADRQRIYINGARATVTTETTPAQNAQSYGNRNVAHYIGSAQNAQLFFDGYLALVHFIDGQALTPSSFGETSATTGQWIAKTYAGTYGTNGFFLDFTDNSTAAALGYDAAGSNDWTVNNLIVGPTTTTNDSWSGYFDGNGDYLTLSSNASMSFGTGTFTIEGWFLTTDKSLSVGAGRTLIGNSGNSYTSQLYITTNGYITFGNTGSTFLQGSTNLADASWHHVAVSRSGTGSNQIAMWVDGTRVALGTNAENYTSGTIYIGAFDTANGYWNGYISNLRIVKGSSVYDPSNSTITVPTSPLTAITNTALLICKSSTFVDNSTNAYTVTANGNARVSRDGPFEIFSDSDSLRDHPTSAGTSTGLGGEVSGNYCTINPLLKGTHLAISNGNLDITQTTNVNRWESSFATFLIPKSGKWYWEIKANGASIMPGITPASANFPQNFGTYPANNTTFYGYVGDSGNKVTGPGDVQTSYGSAAQANDVIGVAFNADAGTLTFYINNVSQGTAFSGLTDSYVPTFGIYYNVAASVNFGQRAFAYTAPSGFSPLVDTLLPTPTIAKPNTVMDALIWTGTSSTNAKTLSGGFSPDFVWIKNRDNLIRHSMFDTVRGGTLMLAANTADAEENVASANNDITFNSDGFTLKSNSGNEYNNYNGYAYAGWCFDGGSSNATNTSGSITSTVRANISAGFSIVTYTGAGSNGTVGHGLGEKPSLLIFKDRNNGSTSWLIYHASLGATQYLDFTTSAATTSSNAFANTEPTSTVFTAGNFLDNATNYVAYCWAPVSSYSSFGQYTGNGLSDGPFVYTGFRPAFIIIKRTSSTGGWYLYDYIREGYNQNNDYLFADSDGNEGTADYLDILSNGFKLRDSATGVNASSSTYTYAAWASAPFPYARAR